MAKKRGRKGLDVQIKELEAAITEAQTCPACGKAVEPDAVTCPYCGAVFGEGADLQVEAAKSLQDLEKHLEAAVEVPPETPQPPKVPTPEPERGGLGTAAEVAAEVEPEGTPEPEAPAEAGPPPAASPKTARVHAVPRPATRRRSSRWTAAVVAGALLSLVAILAVLAILPDIGKAATASVMVLGSVLVAVGIRLRPGGSPPPAPARAMGSEGAPDYVCPLCGTGIPAHASECPTCGALFED